MVCGVRTSLLCWTGPHGRHMALPAQRSAASGQFPLSGRASAPQAWRPRVLAAGWQPFCSSRRPENAGCRASVSSGASLQAFCTRVNQRAASACCALRVRRVDLSGLSPALSVLFPAPSGELQAYTACLFMYCEFVCVLYIKRQRFFCLPTTSFSPFGGEIATVENVSVYRYLMDLLLLEKVSFKIVYFLTAAITN